MASKALNIRKKKYRLRFFFAKYTVVESKLLYLRIVNPNMKTVKPMKIRLISLLLIFSACFSSAFADIVVGRVVDAQTKAPLPDAQIEVQQYFMGALISSSYTTDSLGVFELQAFSRQCVLSVEYLGYYRVRRNFLASEGEDTIRLGDIALKPSDAYLKMAL